MSLFIETLIRRESRALQVSVPELSDTRIVNRMACLGFEFGWATGMMGVMISLVVLGCFLQGAPVYGTSNFPVAIGAAESELLPEVKLTHAIDNKAWPNVFLKLNCRTDKGEVLPEAFLEPGGYYTIAPNVREDPTLCWGCAVRWEERNLWNNFWVFSHGNCQMPLPCTQCLWKVQEQGFSIFDPKKNDYRLVWSWTFPIPPHHGLTANHSG